MVNSMHLGDLLEISNVSDRDFEIRRAFAPYTEPLEVEGCESLVIIILANLTVKRKKMNDLCEVKTANKVLMDEPFFGKCIGAVKWLHSHNLKYPDARVHLQRVVFPPADAVPGCATGAGEPYMLGWSHNSSEVNDAKLFCSFFAWKGEVTNLAYLIERNKQLWLRCLVQHGVSTNRVKLLAAKLSEFLPTQYAPEEVSTYSKQLRIPYQQGYCSVTPIVSHSLQCKIQRLATLKKISSDVVNHAYPASVGDLAASLGGRVKVIKSLPRVRGRADKFRSLADKDSVSGGAIFENSMILQADFLRDLSILTSNFSFISAKDRKGSRKAAIKNVKQTLFSWLTPLMELNDKFNAGSIKLKDIKHGSVEYEFLTVQRESHADLAGRLNVKLHEELYKSNKSREYSFHSELIQLTRKLLKSVISRNYSDNSRTIKDSNRFSYIHFSGLDIYDALAMSTPYITGIPSLTSVWGLSHNFERKLRQLLGHDQVDIVGTAWFISRYSGNNSTKLPEPSRLVKTSELPAVKRPGIINQKYCDMTMDLVMQVHAKHEDKLISNSDLGAIKAAFPSRFAGGCLHPPELSKMDEWCRLYREKSKLFADLLQLSSGGCWIYPVETTCCTIDSIIQQQQDNPSYRLAPVGYVALEEPRYRVNSVSEKHCFAESAIGLVNCIKPIETRFSGINSFFKNAFWQIKVENRTMLVKKMLV